MTVNSQTVLTEFCDRNLYPEYRTLLTVMVQIETQTTNIKKSQTIISRKLPLHISSTLKGRSDLLLLPLAQDFF